jgi:hypothetical protein
MKSQEAISETYILKSLVSASNADTKPAIDYLRANLPEGATLTINPVKQNITIIGKNLNIPVLINELKVNGHTYVVKTGPCDDYYKSQIQKEIYITEKSAEYLQATAVDSLVYTQVEFDQFSQQKQARIVLSDNTTIK